MITFDDIIEKTFNTNSGQLPTLEELSKVMAFDGEDDKIFSEKFWRETLTQQFPSYEQSKLVHDGFSYNYRIRDTYVTYSFPLLIHEFFIDLKNILDKMGINKVIEVAAGGGWFSHWAIGYGINVIKTTDAKSWKTHKQRFFNSVSNHFVIKESATVTVKNSKADLVILSWPPYNNSLAYKVWEVLRPGQYLLYIGEGDGGCTGDDKFHDKAFDKYYEPENGNDYSKLFYLSRELNKNFRSFWSIHDTPYLLEK